MLEIIRKTQNRPVNYTYPMLMESNDGQSVALFTSEGIGMILKSDDPNEADEIMEWSIDWEPSEFKPLPMGSSVTIIQQ